MPQTIPWALANVAQFLACDDATGQLVVANLLDKHSIGVLNTPLPTFRTEIDF